MSACLKSASEFGRARARQAEAQMDRAEQPKLEILVVDADRGLERADQVADDVFRRVVQQRHQPRLARQAGLELRRQPLHQHAMLRDREGVRALGLAVPARDAGKAMRDVLDLDVQRRGIEQVEPAAAQHALPGSCLRLFGHFPRFSRDRLT